ncbi:MAG: hypothetical protein INQ03_01485 [Candidatus Heimdallarchaeota archaeon]|nr:hypothetical protein [Candidatus Heimdallarchaeota archaeon]
MKSILLITSMTVVVILIPGIIVGVEIDSITDHPFPDDLTLFNSTSPFNMKIPENAAYEEDSKSYTDFLKTNQVGDKIFVTVDEWSYPIYFADENTPRYDVKLTEKWSDDFDTIEGMPIPDGAEPDPEGDAHLVVIDLENRIEYDLWETSKTLLGDWKAGWGNTISLDSDGVYYYGLSARGSGFAASTGVILPNEILNGKIDHALFFSIDDLYVKAGGPIRPASESDGSSDAEFAIPEGGRLQLDPAIDIDSLGLNEQDKTIAIALQEYGVILGDNGGGFGMYAANPIGSNWDWGEYFPRDSDQSYLSYLFDGKISIGDLKLLKMGCQIAEAPIYKGQHLPDYHIYLEGEEVDESECSDLGDPIYEDGPGFEFLGLIPLAIIPILNKKRNTSIADCK